MTHKELVVSALENGTVHYISPALTTDNYEKLMNELKDIKAEVEPDEILLVIDSMTGHGGLFKTPVVGQKYMAAACNAPVTCMQTAGEGGPYGMALLAAFLRNRETDETLEEYLGNRVFAGVSGTTLEPDPADVAGFNDYVRRYTALLQVEQTAIEVL